MPPPCVRRVTYPILSPRLGTQAGPCCVLFSCGYQRGQSRIDITPPLPPPLPTHTSTRSPPPSDKPDRVLRCCRPPGLSLCRPAPFSSKVDIEPALILSRGPLRSASDHFFAFCSSRLEIAYGFLSASDDSKKNFPPPVWPTIRSLSERDFPVEGGPHRHRLHQPPAARSQGPRGSHTRVRPPLVSPSNAVCRCFAQSVWVLLAQRRPLEARCLTGEVAGMRCPSPLTHHHAVARTSTDSTKDPPSSFNLKTRIRANDRHITTPKLAAVNHGFQ